MHGSSEPEIKWKEVAITARRTALDFSGLKFS